MLGPERAVATCPECNETMTTTLSRGTQTSTHVAACLLCIVFFPLACLPYFLREPETKHYCSNCKAVLGTYVPPDTTPWCICIEEDPICCLSCCLDCADCCGGDSEPNGCDECGECAMTCFACDL